VIVRGGRLRFSNVSAGYLIPGSAPSSGKEVLLMGLADKARNKVQVLKGKTKEAAGKITRNPELEVKGKLDQGKGHLKQVGEKVRDAGKGFFGPRRPV
jgi:uncharacterized protein YjbJ (UPF0337 family)